MLQFSNKLRKQVFFSEKKSHTYIEAQSKTNLQIEELSVDQQIYFLVNGKSILCKTYLQLEQLLANYRFIYSSKD